MMNHRFSLFNAGYTSYAPAFYYNKLSLVSTLENEEDEKVKDCVKGILQSLKDHQEEETENVKTAIGLAEQFELTTLPMPASHAEYFSWLSHYIDTFEKQFPMSRIDHYYFLYSRKISEIICNSCLLKSYISLSLNADGKVDLFPKMEKCLKDNEYILFKLIAAAALLSSEPRHNFFNVNYKTINSSFEPFRGINIRELDPARLKSLSDETDKFELTVRDGYKKCVELLRELEV